MVSVVSGFPPKEGSSHAEIKYYSLPALVLKFHMCFRSMVVFCSGSVLVSVNDEYTFEA